MTREVLWRWDCTAILPDQYCPNLEYSRKCVPLSGGVSDSRAGLEISPLCPLDRGAHISCSLLPYLYIFASLVSCCVFAFVAYNQVPSKG